MWHNEYTFGFYKYISMLILLHFYPNNIPNAGLLVVTVFFALCISKFNPQHIGCIDMNAMTWRKKKVPHTKLLKVFQDTVGLVAGVKKIWMLLIQRLSA